MDCSPLGSSVHAISQATILDGLPFPSPGDLPDPGLEPTSPALVGEFTTEPPSAWEIPQTEEPGGLQFIGLQKELDMTEVTLKL